MSNPYVDIQPGSIAQVQAALSGHMIVVDDDVQGIANGLQEIDSSLRLHYDGHQELWVVTQEVHRPDGSVDEKLVTSHAGDLDHRLLNRVRQIASRDYDFAGEIERSERAAESAAASAHSETVGPLAERLLHAMKKDLGYDQNRIFVPGRD